MRPVAYYLNEYGNDHRNPTNKALHRVCVPLIVLSLLGLLWSLPTPTVVSGPNAYINWATAFATGALLYYLLLSPRLAAGMLAVLIACIFIIEALSGGKH